MQAIRFKHVNMNCSLSNNALRHADISIFFDYYRT